MLGFEKGKVKRKNKRKRKTGKNIYWEKSIKRGRKRKTVVVSWEQDKQTRCWHYDIIIYILLSIGEHTIPAKTPTKPIFAPTIMQSTSIPAVPSRAFVLLLYLRFLIMPVVLSPYAMKSAGTTPSQKVLSMYQVKSIINPSLV